MAYHLLGRHKTPTPIPTPLPTPTPTIGGAATRSASASISPIPGSVADTIARPLTGATDLVAYFSLSHLLAKPQSSAIPVEKSYLPYLADLPGKKMCVNDKTLRDLIMQPMPENALSINPFENDVLVAAFTLASGEVLGYSNADFGADNLSKLDEKKSREVGRSKTETQKIGSISTPGLSNGSKSTQKGARESNGSLGGVVGPGTSNRMNPPSLVQNIQFAQTQSKTTQKQPTQPQSQSQSLQLKSEQQIAQPKLKIRLFSSSTAGGMASPVPAGPNLVIHPSVADDGGGEKKFSQKNKPPYHQKKKKRHHEDDDPNNPDEGADHKKKKKKKKHSHHEDEAEIIID